MLGFPLYIEKRQSIYKFFFFSILNKALGITNIFCKWGKHKYLFSELLDDARFEVSKLAALTEVCAGGGLLDKKLLISLQMARNG